MRRVPALITVLTALSLAGCGKGTLIGSNVTPSPTPVPTQVTKEWPLPAASGPVGIAVTTAGFYIALQSASKLAFMNAATPGSFTEYSTPTANAQPFGVTIWNSNPWITEEAAGKVAEFLPTVNILAETSLPTPNSGPTYLAPGPDGNLWVSETAADKIARIALNPSTGAVVVTEFALPTANAAPTGLAYIPGDHNILWIAESNASAVIPFDTSALTFGTAVPTVTPNADPQQMILGPDGQIWFTEEHAAALGRVTATGAMTEYPLAPAASAYGLVIGNDNNLYFTDPANNAFGSFTVTSPTPAVKEYPFPTASSSPAFMVLAPDNLLYATETAGNNLAQIDY